MWVLMEGRAKKKNIYNKPEKRHPEKRKSALRGYWRDDVMLQPVLRGQHPVQNMFPNPVRVILDEVPA